MMDTRFLRLVRLIAAAWLVLGAVPRPGRAQTPPTLSIQLSIGSPILSVTGQVGTVYSIQYSTGLASTNVWVDRTLMQVQVGMKGWTDPSGLSSTQRFYRAVSLPALADTNLVFIQPGTFTMGSPTNEEERWPDESPQTKVTVSRGFWMSKYLVTQGQYSALISTNPAQFIGDSNRPVETVSWGDATNYCGKLSEQERAAGRLPTGYVYRLPTEAEWEYACRAGTTTRFSYGDDPYYSALFLYAWYWYSGFYAMHPVGQLLPNTWGLYDMHGSVFEWCEDWYGPYHGGSVVDPQGAASGTLRVLRGGCWATIPRNCRSANRRGLTRDEKNDYCGFRIVLAPAQP